MNDDQIKHMTNRFLGWRLPENFRPDGGVQFDADGAKKLNPRNLRYEPYGTNLFDATQAEAMVRHMVEGLPPPARVPEVEEIARIIREWVYPYRGGTLCRVPEAAQAIRLKLTGGEP